MELESSIHGADPPLFVDPFALSVTIGTAMGFNEKGSEQPHNLHAHVGFRIRKFEHHDIRDLSNFLGQDLVSTTGPIIIIVENWHKWANSSFKEALPALPSKLITELDSGLGFPTIPIFKDGDEFDEFYAATKHFDSVSSPSSENSQVTSPREQKKIRSSVIATWVKKQGAFVQDPERPTIVIFGRKISGPFTQRIVNHYQSEHARRWGRLCACLPWIFADIFTIFTNWDGVLQGTRLNIKFKEQQMFNRDTITPIARKTQELHQDASETLALQEGLRMHQASFKHFKRGLTKTSVENQMKDLDTRLDYIFELLDFYETTCDSIIQQQKNLQSLAFNLETVRQSRAVARLNTLAIVFLPISFIASIFGITTITIPAYWYPVAAIPTLLVTCTIAFVISASSDVGGRICSRMKIFSLPYHQCPPFSWRRRHIGRVDRDLQRRIDENLAAMELAWAAQPVFYQCTTTMPYERAQDQH